MLERVIVAGEVRRHKIYNGADAGFMELVDQLPEGTILSVNLEEVADGQEDG